MNHKMISKVTSGVLLCTMLAYTSPVFAAYTKEETVYTKINEEGKSYQTIVNSHIKNEGQEKLIHDLSDLLNIENVNGNEEFTQDGNVISWQADGEDIYYQGKTEKELPIECTVTYELDGEKIEAKDLAGKSGKVKITIEYINKDAHRVSVNGKYETLYTPFVVLCGTIIDNNNNKNIAINNGKVIDNGNKTIVIGLSLPGMQESLGISENTVEIPSTVEITMDATDFEMNNIVTYVTPKVIEEDDIKIFDKLDEIYDKVNTLQSSSSQLVEGSAKLKEGTEKLNHGTQELSSKLNSAISQYDNAKSKYTSKQGKAEIEKKIVDMVNSELKKMMPELEKEAQKEALNVIKGNKEKLEKATTKTALEYTNKAIEGKLKELEENKESIITISDELMNEIEKDLDIALQNIEENKDIKALEGQIKEIIVSDVKSTVKGKTEAAITDKVKEMKDNISDPTMLLAGTADAATLKAYKENIASAMVPAIKAKLMAADATLTSEKAQEKAEKQATETVNALVTTVSKKTMDTTLDQVAKEAPKMAEGAVQEATSKLNTSKELYTAISNYKEKVVSTIKNKIPEKALTAMEESIENAIIEELEKSFENDKVLQAQIQTYGSKAKAELNSTIDKVAEDTAKQLASDFTVDLATQITNNLIQKQLKGELKSSDLDKELNKYETLINQKLNKVDSSVATLKDALNQLTAGTEELANGATKLAEGMSKFDKEGIQKICSYVNGDVKDVATRLEKLQKLSEEYNNFTMLEDGNQGNVKFIMMMDGIKKDKSKEQEMILTDGTTPTEKKDEE